MIKINSCCCFLFVLALNGEANQQIATKRNTQLSITDIDANSLPTAIVIVMNFTKTQRQKIRNNLWKFVTHLQITIDYDALYAIQRICVSVSIFSQIYGPRFSENKRTNKHVFSSAKEKKQTNKNSATISHLISYLYKSSCT